MVTWLRYTGTDEDGKNCLWHSSCACLKFTYGRMQQPYFSTTPPSLLISSSATRLAASNRADSVAKLHDVICTTAQSMIVKPTSEEQKLKVRDLMGKDAARRKAEKVKKSMKKESRRKGGWD